MLKEKYKHMSDQIHPSDELLHKTLHAASGREKRNIRKFLLLRKPVAVLVALCLCLTLSVPALAANIESIYQLMYLVSPGIAQFFMPVQQSDESNGIKMEVVSASIHENTAEIYVTLQDVTGDRIDGSTDLYDSYSIHRPFDSSAHCELIGYEDSTKTATFLITIEEWGNHNITGDKITFSVREFLSHKKTYENVEIPISLSDISAARQTQSVSLKGGGGKDYKRNTNAENNPALIPTKPMDEFPVDGIDFTGIAYLDGKLHVQTAVKNPLDNDNHGFFYLKDKNGTVINCNYSFYFSNQELESDSIVYHESVFDIPQAEISNYALYGHFVTSGMKTEGDWQITFPLKSMI